MGIWNKKINLNLSGTSFTDELHVDVGAATFTLNHDWFMNDTGEELIIRTSSGGGGTLLVEDTDYTISNQDTYLSTEAAVNVYSTVQITNAAYQTGNLYFSGKYVADSVNAEDNVETIVDVSTTGTIGYDYLPVELCTGGTNGVRRTLPDASTCESMKLTFMKDDTGIGAVTLVPYTAQTINGMSYVFLTEQYQKVTIISDGANWRILSGILYFISGGQNTSDWTNREFGFATVAFDGAVGTLLIGETLTEETSGITGVLIYNSGTALTLLKVSGVGYFTNDKTLTGGISGATVEVNNASTTKNADQSCRHGTGFNGLRISVEIWISPNATFSWTNAVRIGRYANNAMINMNYEVWNIDTNTLKCQTGASGFAVIAEDGTLSYGGLDGEDYSFNVILRLDF